MTRINIGIDPKILTRQHLIAEAREIKRIPNTVRSGKAKLQGIPEQFTLGTGHVKFFYNKLGYLLNRYKSIYTECRSRGYNVQDFSNAWNGIPQELMGDYQPTERDMQIIMQRLKEKDNQYSKYDKREPAQK